ncbi:MAG: hypothetical protein K2L72_05565 [Clostridia bacterium]|nr:hypothetical protein [Clostridia bacterium]
MKRILALALTSILLIGGAGAAASVSASAEDKYAPVQARTAGDINIYLVPGTYTEAGEKVENSVSSGADKLEIAECEKIFTENAYVCTLAEGEALPVPSSTRRDKEGNAYAFNGWWTIVDATVTYFDKVPSVTETTFLYADWRADLSQRRDPVVPDEGEVILPKHYMSIKRAATGETDIVTLNIAGTDVPNAYDLGYGAPVQIYNDWFELNPDDELTVFTAGIEGSTEPEQAPVLVGGKSTITLERSDAENNDTADYLEKAASGDKVICSAQRSAHYRIYIKFYDRGGTMTIYMQPKD